MGGLLGFIKDVILLPVDIALDLTMITPMIRAVEDKPEDTPFGTVDRLRSMARNFDKTKEQ
jgi:hypothetical protein